MVKGIDGRKGEWMKEMDNSYIRKWGNVRGERGNIYEIVALTGEVNIYIMDFFLVPESKAVPSDLRQRKN